MSNKNVKCTPPPRTRSNSVPGVSLADVQQLINACKTELISAFKNEINKLSLQFDGMKERIVNIEASLASFKAKTDEHSREINEIKECCQKLNGDVMCFMSDELDERMYRMNNIIISGIPETDGSLQARIDHDRQKVCDIMEEIDPSLEESRISSVNRVGRLKANQSRLLRVSMTDYNAKVSILRNAKNLKNSQNFEKVYVNPDRTKFQALEFARLRKEYKERKTNGEDVMLYRKKIIQKSDAPSRNFL